MRVAVIGGGPSGLVTLKYLITAHEFFPGLEPIEAKLFEAEEAIGGTFRYRDYEDSELVSSRQLTTFSDFRLYPAKDFLSTKAYCEYLDDYCENFNLNAHINLSTYVTKVQRLDGGGHLIHYDQNGHTSEWFCDAVAVCSGLHVLPNIPVIPGMERIPTVIHSSEFKSKKQFGVDQNVLIVGSGETGMDIAHLAVTGDTKSVTLCHRDGFYLAPKFIPEVCWFGMKPLVCPQGDTPADVGNSSLFETSYVHRWLRDSPLGWAWYTFFARAIFTLTTGTRPGYDQWVGGLAWEKHDTQKIFINKSTKAIPYISKQYRKKSLLNSIRYWILHFREIPIRREVDRIIDLAPLPEYIDEDGVVKFVDSDRPEAAVMKTKVVKPDVLVFATGYTQDFSFLDESYPVPADADMRSIWKTGDETVGFFGFERPSLGAIPPLAELQAQLWILNLLGRLPTPLQYEDWYKLARDPGARIHYGVDHDSYAYQLAVDAGTAPSFTELLAMGWKITICWALITNVNTKFRLVGPWKWDGARSVMEGEMWQVVSRKRSWFYHTGLYYLPMLLFGSLSAACWAVEQVWKIAKRAWKIFTLNY